MHTVSWVRRHWSCLVVILACLACLSPWVQASEASLPNGPIKLIVAFSPGSASDILARSLSEQLGKAIGRQVIVENRPGAGGQIAFAAAARAAADGSTLLFGTTGLIQGYALKPDEVPFHPVKDFRAVTEVARAPLLLVIHSSVPASTLGEFIALVKENPKAFAIAHTGPGTSGHIFSSLLAAQARIDLEQVPYKGTGQMMTDLIGGHLKAAFQDTGTAFAQMKSGHFKILAITGSDRNASVPDVPTFSELGFKGFDPYGFYGIFAPRGVPDNTVALLSKELVRIIAQQEVRDRIKQMGIEPTGVPFDKFEQSFTSDTETWTRSIRDLGIAAR